MIKALIFDLDGTLADTIGAITEALNMVMDDLGYEHFSQTEVKEFVNYDTRAFIEYSLRDTDKSYDRVTEVMKLYADKYSQTYMHTDCPFDGIVEMLSELKKCGYRLGMLSNKADEFVIDLDSLLFTEKFFEICHGVRPGIPAKPYPDGPLEMAAYFGVEPNECAFIGDSDIDVATAKNSGMLALDVCWGYRSEEFLNMVGAEYIAHTPDEVIKILNKIN